MARSLHRLTDLQVQRAKKPGLQNDGGGLNLSVSKTGSRSWVFRYFVNGGERKKGLGAYPATSLSEARRRAQACRKQQAKGEDPIDATEEDETPAFGVFADALVASLE